MNFHVSIIIVGYNGDRWLPECVRSLSEASAHRQHLILVDNLNNPCLDHLDVSAFDCEVIRTPHPMGFAEANNYALVNASRLEGVVLFLNQDTISRPRWIDQCLGCFEQSGSLGAVSPLIRTYDGTQWDPSFLACLTAKDMVSAGSLAQLEADWFATENAPAPALFVRTDVLREVGPFDPVFGSYYEDYDLCRRIGQHGHLIGFCRRAEILHYSGSTTDNPVRELKRMRQIIRNRLLYKLRLSDPSRLSELVSHFLIRLPRNLVRGILKTPSSQPPGVTLKAHFDLLRIWGRLISKKQDEALWHEYLRRLGWPQCLSHTPTREEDNSYA